MSAIWSDIAIDWDGETYTVKPTIEFLNYIEQGQGSSLSVMLVRLGKGDLPSGKACELIAKTINYADPKANVSASDVFEATSGIGADIVACAQAILLGCMPAPQGDNKKKLKAQPNQT